ncbi:MAG: nitronate monooxygenase family protein [Candidatus Omnitrophota bacterium]|nr:nitronate monooxygenase family protein [Candidatus Omnitrophota bacterium]
MINTLKPLLIGDLEVKVPIVQGGMGVQVSTASLASAVANCGGAGTIASVGLAYGIDEQGREFVEASNEALSNEIREAKRLTRGVVGVNIMVALSNFEDLVRTAAKEHTDFIVSGAGLPLKLPEYTEGSSTKLIPIVSSARAADLIIKTWKKRYNILPAAIVVEGSMAGGHIGFKLADLLGHTEERVEDLFTSVLKMASGYEKEYNAHIPVIPAGGIFDGKDMARFLNMGAGAVQMATRFVTTFECSVSEKFKSKYLEAGSDDVIIIDSPVGMPARAIKNRFTDRLISGERVPFNCRYKCLRTCDPATAPYCIAKALCNAAQGDIDNAVVFAGSNVSRVKKIVSVKELVDEIAGEALRELNNEKRQ